jgi:mycofactocin precursor
VNRSKLKQQPRRTRVPDPSTQAPSAPCETDDGQRVGAAEPPDVELVESDLLIEDVSIDGMCGVY